MILTEARGMRIFRVAFALAILLTVTGCNRDEPSAPAESAEPARLAAAVQTPAFRNLGKRGDSKL